MPYLIAALFAIGFAAGFGTAHEIDKASVLTMELAIQAQKIEAADLLAHEKERSAQAQLKAVEINQNLEKFHEAFIATANDYKRRLDALSLPIPVSWTSRTRAVSPCDRAGISQATAAEAELAEEVGRIVREEGAKGDEAGDYAAQAHAWVMTLK